jgi:hypothetical protein
MKKKRIRNRSVQGLEDLAASGITVREIADVLGFTLGGLIQRLRSDRAGRRAYDKGRIKAHKNPFGVGRSRPLADRFWEKVDKTNYCWLWTGAKQKGGYGLIMVDGKVELAHRVSYRLNVGPIPKGKAIRHVVCDNPPCVRPDHTAPGSHQQNMNDMYAKGRRKAVRGKKHPRWKHGRYVKEP